MAVILRFQSLFFQAKHATAGNTTWGIDGESGDIVDMKDFGIWEPYSVKAQVYKTAVEVCMVVEIILFIQLLTRVLLFVLLVNVMLNDSGNKFWHSY